MKLSINQENTINIGDFSNVKCGSFIEINNVKTEDLFVVQDLLREINYILFLLNWINSADDVLSLVNSNDKVCEFHSYLITNQNAIKKDLKEKIDQLKEMGYDI